MEPPKLTKSATDRKRQKIRQRNRKILGNLGIENGNSVCLRRKKRKGSPEFHVNIDLVRAVCLRSILLILNDYLCVNTALPTFFTLAVGKVHL